MDGKWSCVRQSVNQGSSIYLTLWANVDGPQLRSSIFPHLQVGSELTPLPWFQGAQVPDRASAGLQDGREASSAERVKKALARMVLEGRETVGFRC